MLDRVKPSWAVRAVAADVVAVVTSVPFVLGCVQLCVLLLRLPFLEQLRGWLYVWRDTPIGPASLVFALALAPLLAVLLVRWARRRLVLALAALCLLGFAYQHGLAWSEGAGLHGMRKRIELAPHGGFAIAAARQPSAWDVLVHYEHKAARGQLSNFAPTKPPGTVLAYMLNERVARVFASGASETARLEASRDLAALLWPLSAYLVLVPLFMLLSRVVDRETALHACVLYLFVPTTALITLQLDLVLFPLLTVGVWTLAAAAQLGRTLRLGFAAGVLAYLTAFMSFGPVAAMPIALAFAWAAGASEQALPLRARTTARVGLAALFGFLCLMAAFQWTFDYDLPQRWRRALAQHAGWSHWEDTLESTVYYGWVNCVEFALWLGLPLAALTASGMQRALRKLAQGAPDGMSVPASAGLLVFCMLAFFGHTKGEVARLWAFMIPLCCAVAAHELDQRPATQRKLTLGAVLALQSLLVLLTKARQDY